MVDPTQPLGQTRLNLGDMTFTPVTPANPDGTDADFRYFSDAELTAFLLQGDSNPLMATGFAYLTWARDAAKLQAFIKTADLNIDSTAQAAQFRLLADEYFTRANNVEWFTLNPSAEEIIDVRDYMYPTGGRTTSDIFYETDASNLLPDGLL